MRNSPIVVFLTVVLSLTTFVSCVQAEDAEYKLKDLEYKFEIGKSLKYKFTTHESSKGKATLTSEVDFILTAIREVSYPLKGTRISYRKLHRKGKGDPDQFRKLQILFNKDTRYFATLTPKGRFLDVWVAFTPLTVFLSDSELLPSNSFPPCWVAMPGDNPSAGHAYPAFRRGATFPGKDGNGTYSARKDMVPYKGYDCIELTSQEPLVDEGGDFQGKRMQTVYFDPDKGLLVGIIEIILWERNDERWVSKTVGSLEDIRTISASELDTLNRKDVSVRWLDKEISRDSHPAKDKGSKTTLINEEMFGAFEACMFESFLRSRQTNSRNVDKRLEGLDAEAELYRSGKLSAASIVSITQDVLKRKGISLDVRDRASSMLAEARGGRRSSEGNSGSVLIGGHRGGDPSRGNALSKLKLAPIFPARMMGDLTPFKGSWGGWLKENKDKLLDELFRKNEDRINKDWWKKNKDKIGAKELDKNIDDTFLWLLRFRDAGVDYFQVEE